MLLFLTFVSGFLVYRWRFSWRPLPVRPSVWRLWILTHLGHIHMHICNVTWTMQHPYSNPHLRGRWRYSSSPSLHSGILTVSHNQWQGRCCSAQAKGGFILLERGSRTTAIPFFRIQHRWRFSPSILWGNRIPSSALIQDEEGIHPHQQWLVTSAQRQTVSLGVCPPVLWMSHSYAMVVDTGKTSLLEVESYATVNNVKTRIQDTENFPAHQQTLFWPQKQPRDDSLLPANVSGRKSTLFNQGLFLHPFWICACLLENAVILSYPFLFFTKSIWICACLLEALVCFVCFASIKLMLVVVVFFLVRVC